MITSLLPQFVGLVLLAIGVWLCYRRWIQPRAELGRQERGLLGLTILTLIGGGSAILPFRRQRTDHAETYRQRAKANKR